MNNKYTCGDFTTDMEMMASGFTMNDQMASFHDVLRSLANLLVDVIPGTKDLSNLYVRTLYHAYASGREDERKLLLNIIEQVKAARREE